MQLFCCCSGCLLDGVDRDSTPGSEPGRVRGLRPRVEEDRQPPGHLGRAADPAGEEAAEEQPDADGHLNDSLRLLVADQLVQRHGKRADRSATSLDFPHLRIDDNWYVNCCSILAFITISFESTLLQFKSTLC